MGFSLFGGFWLFAIATEDTLIKFVTDHCFLCHYLFLLTFIASGHSFGFFNILMTGGLDRCNIKNMFVVVERSP